MQNFGRDPFGLDMLPEADMSGIEGEDYSLGGDLLVAELRIESPESVGMVLDSRKSNEPRLQPELGMKGGYSASAVSSEVIAAKPCPESELRKKVSPNDPMTTNNRFETAKKQKLYEPKNTRLRSQINDLAEDVYEHFLRESCDPMMDGEWYQMARAVADRFRELILESRKRNDLRVCFDHQPTSPVVKEKTR